MHLFAKTLTGKVIQLEVEKSETVGDVKRKVEEKEGIPVASQRLILARDQERQRLDDNGRTLADLNIPDQATLFLLIGCSGHHRGDHTDHHHKANLSEKK
jgi:hypothetical protein